jgi:hypothetical protein
MRAGNIKKPKMTIGWREWVALPSLGIPAIKVKVDTGARTSSLHAFRIKPFKTGGRKYVRFMVHPFQHRREENVSCVAEVADRRYIRDSSGRREFRYVVKSLIHMDGRSWEIEISLTNRAKMNFRMLLGRSAMRGVRIAPRRSFLLGKPENVE